MSGLYDSSLVCKGCFSLWLCRVDTRLVTAELNECPLCNSKEDIEEVPAVKVASVKHKPKGHYKHFSADTISKVLKDPRRSSVVAKELGVPITRFYNLKSKYKKEFALKSSSSQPQEKSMKPGRQPKYWKRQKNATRPGIE